MKTEQYKRYFLLLAAAIMGCVAMPALAMVGSTEFPWKCTPQGCTLTRAIQDPWPDDKNTTSQLFSVDPPASNDGTPVISLQYSSPGLLPVDLVESTSNEVNSFYHDFTNPYRIQLPLKGTLHAWYPHLITQWKSPSSFVYLYISTQWQYIGPIQSALASSGICGSSLTLSWSVGDPTMKVIKTYVSVIRNGATGESYEFLGAPNQISIPDKACGDTVQFNVNTQLSLNSRILPPSDIVKSIKTTSKGAWFVPVILEL